LLIIFFVVIKSKFEHQSEVIQ